jgi:hypothetical protein
MLNEAPLEKSTPWAWRMALPLKLRAPDGSLGSAEGRNVKNKEDNKRKKKIERSQMSAGKATSGATHTIFEKLAKGVPKSP